MISVISSVLFNLSKNKINSSVVMRIVKQTPESWNCRFIPVYLGKIIYKRTNWILTATKKSLRLFPTFIKILHLYSQFQLI